jgi:putative chitinase
MQQVRDLLGHPIFISSGYRSPILNRRVGGAKLSDHMFGKAADFTCRGLGTPLEVCRAIAASNIIFDQLIYEGTWVHISFSPTPRCQVLTAVFTRGYPATYFAGLKP